MAAAHPDTTTTTTERTHANASPLDRHAPPTAGSAKRSGRAMTALIIGIISIPAAVIALLGVVLGIIAIVLGATARSDARRNRLLGEGQATAGLICGIVGLILGLANMVAGAIMFS